MSAAADDVAEVENRQIHTNDHAADDDAEENDEHRFEQRHQTRKRGLDFFIQKIGHAFEHVVNVAGLFTGAHHADDHAGENGMLGQGGRNAFAALDVGGGSFDGAFDDGVVHGLRNDLQHFQNRHATAHKRGESAREAHEA